MSTLNADVGKAGGAQRGEVIETPPTKRALRPGGRPAPPATPNGTCGPSRPGMDGALDLTFRAVDGVTRLSKSSHRPPLRIVRPFAQVDGSVLVHLQNIGGGVLSGDRLRTRIDIGETARVQITTTGATRIYRTRDGVDPARQETDILVGQNALVEYLPDPLIPFAGASYEQRTRITLAGGLPSPERGTSSSPEGHYPSAGRTGRGAGGEGSRGAGLFWWETVAPGRIAQGELFEYNELKLTADIDVDGRPIACERVRLRPKVDNPTSTARLGPYRYLSTFYICRTGEPASTWSTLENEIGEVIEAASVPGESTWSATALVRHGLVVRGLTRESLRTQSILFECWRIAKRRLYGVEPVLPRKIY